MKEMHTNGRVFAAVCCSLALWHAQSEVVEDGKCSQIRKARPRSESPVAMGSNSLLQQTSQGLRTEMAWEEEGAQRKMEEGIEEDVAEELLLLRQKETEAKASSETLQDEKALFRNPGLERCQHRNPWIQKHCEQRLKAHQEREKAKQYARERRIRRAEAMKKARRLEIEKKNKRNRQCAAATKNKPNSKFARGCREERRQKKIAELRAKRRAESAERLAERRKARYDRLRKAQKDREARMRVHQRVHHRHHHGR